MEVVRPRASWAYPPGLELDIAEFLSAHRRYLAEHGLCLTFSDDFNALAMACQECEHKAPLNAFFDPQSVDVLPHAALWIAGHSSDGALVHVQAMQCQDLGWSSLADWWRMNFARIYSVPMSDRQSAAAENIRGRVVLHGEFWIDRPQAVARLSPALGRLALGYALSRWRPDYIYGLTTYGLARAGFAARMGYHHTAKRAVDWGVDVALAPWDPTDVMAYSDQRELVDLVSLPAEEYFAGS